jgi:putrescine transport system substrate-binding protein
MRPRAIGFAAIGALALAALAGCGDLGKKPQTLRIYNWSDYIDPTILSDFKKETGINVVYDTYDNNEIVETRLLAGGSGYDIAVPSNQYVERLAQAGALAEIDQTKLSNRTNLWPFIVQQMEKFDPGLAHSVPYMWGTVGIGYNVEAVQKRLPGVAIDSWAIAFDPANLAKLKDCGVMFLDSAEEIYPAVLRYQGKDPNSTNVADYEAATELLMALRPSIQKFHSSELINALAGGDICLAIGYSGDVFQAKTRAASAGASGASAKAVTIDYVIPKEGAQLWFDSFVMPKDAPNKEAAHTFINYILRPDVAARASNYVQYASGNLPAKQLVDPAVRDNPGVYPSDEVLSRAFVVTTKAPTLVRDINREWTKVRSGI